MYDEDEQPKAKLEQAVGNAFYVVMRDKESSYVSFRHKSYLEAYAEAQRLAKKENKRFYVLQAVTVVESMQTIVSGTIDYTQ
jgi:hypothetical protein